MKLSAWVVRPKSVLHAFGAGVVISLMVVGVFAAMFGWMPLIVGISEDAKEQTRVLSQAVWAHDEVDRTNALKKANQLYEGLNNIPVSVRADIVADRMVVDPIAAAPAMFSGGTCL